MEDGCAPLTCTHRRPRKSSENLIVDEEDQAAATAAGKCPTLFTPLYIKRQAWRTLREMILTMKMFDTTICGLTEHPLCHLTDDTLIMILHTIALAATDFHVKQEGVTALLMSIAVDLVGEALHRTNPVEAGEPAKADELPEKFGCVGFRNGCDHRVS